MLAFSFVGHSQIINFPDPNFKNALVNSKCVDTDGDGWGDTDADLNDDGEIEVNEALMIKSLNFISMSFESAEGIHFFKSLIKLYFFRNFNLTLLDLHGLQNLEILDCNNNRINNLNLQGLVNLKLLNCSYNRITELNIDVLENLQSIYCNNNEIKSLDFTNFNKLELINCDDNKLETIIIQGLPNLVQLHVKNNQLVFLNIRDLSKLESVICNKNKISLINLKGLLNLKELHCSYNKLDTIDLQGLKSLVSLYCSNNILKSIEFKGLDNLLYIDISFNAISKLNLKELKKLIGISFLGNFIEFIDLQGLPNLQSFNCNFNLLKSLDVTGLNELKSIYCKYNQINFLNFQNLTNLYELDCSYNQLKYLNIKGTKIYGNNSKFSDNNDLLYICCDESKIDHIKQKSLLNGQNCEVNSYCSFTPGGEFYTIRGINSYDENKNGCNDQDLKLPYFKYKITDGGTLGSFYSNSTGNYTIPVQEGTHTITPTIEYPDHFEVTPSSLTVTFPSTSDTITQNFCITPKGIIRQTNITVIPLTPPARPGFDASYKIVWENVGNQIESGTLNFTYDETLLDYISATQTADQVADGIIKWNFSNLLPFEKREITVTLKVNRPTDTPAVNAGDKLYLTASILDNIFTLENTVVGSYDPNDKTCLQGDRVKPDMVGKYVNYLIRFENTGNYAAENVVVKDIIDTKTFDVSSLQITDASHEVYTRIESNKVEFIFENIQLPFDDANNDGYIAFKIKTLPTLVLGDSLKNLADIYFDYNFPIRTNEAQTTIALPSFTKDIATEINIYPNPVRDILYLESDENWSKAEIYDISGRIMRLVTLFGQSLDVSELESGTYFMRLKDGEKVGVVKFVKM